MKSTALLKLAASVLIMGSTMVGCGPTGQVMRPANASDAKLAKLATKAAAAAAKSIAARDFANAVVSAETAVGAMPRDASYRLLLGQAYLGAGRFSSAHAAFSDTLKLSPDHDRAALNLALVEIALGKKNAALTTLGEYREKLAASDYGLAMALAGDTIEAVRVLETAVRSPEADAKARQNLALAYALAGDWNAAKVMAGQDLAPADTDARMMQWAALAKPDGGPAQVAAVLGVTPAIDAGQPTRLALAPSNREAVQAALVATAPKPVAAPIIVPVPVEVAAATPAPTVVSMALPAFETAPVAPTKAVALAPTKPVATAPIIRAAAAPAKQIIVPYVRNAVTNKAPAKAPRGVESGRFVVQLGAYENAAVSHDAWKRLAPRFGLRGFDPANSAAKVNGATFVRLSVAGFNSRAEASQVCTRIRNVGGTCFVRGMLSDKPAVWVQRGMPKPMRLASR